jgi:hypothetical protein
MVDYFEGKKWEAVHKVEDEAEDRKSPDWANLAEHGNDDNPPPPNSDKE